jgi:hypothetical protein
MSVLLLDQGVDNEKIETRLLSCFIPSSVFFSHRDWIFGHPLLIKKNRTT